MKESFFSKLFRTPFIILVKNLETQRFQFKTRRFQLETTRNQDENLGR
jgi:hypothetical protein